MQIRYPLVVLLFVFGSFVAFAQKPDDALKEKEARRDKLVEQILTELPNLGLAENRAIAAAKAGNFLWKSDPERARGLFVGAAAELAEAQLQADINQKRSGVQGDLLSGGSTRQLILNLLSDHDAELALELLAKTRPPMLARAVAEPRNAAKIDVYGNLSYLMQNEDNLEQSLIRKAADQNPARMIKLLKEGLAKNISYESLSLLRKLYEKEPASAKEIGGQIIDKLIGARLVQNDHATNVVTQNAFNFLNYFIQQRDRIDKSFRFEESQMRTLADRLIAYYLTSGTNFNYSIVSIAEKLAPGKVEQLKSQTQNFRGGFQGGYLNPELQKLFSSNPTADQLLAAAKKFPAENKAQIYQHAVGTMVQQGNFDLASAFIHENYDGDSLADAMRNLNSQYAYRLISEGRFAEAERLIDEQPENMRTNSLINLANAIYQKDRIENKAYATAVIGKVHATLPEKPENNADMGKFIQVINGYATIDAPDAFRLYEQLVPQINDLTEAAVVLSPFQGNTNVQKGEFIINQGGPLQNLGLDLSVFNRFAGKDFDQTIRLIETFTRRETRIILKFQVIESLR